MTTESPPVKTLDLAVATGLTEGAKLRDCRRVQLTDTRALFNPNCTKEQWIEFGRHLRMVKTAARFYHADWLRFGRVQFGDAAVAAAVEQLAFDLDDMERATQVALLDPAARRADLPASYHEVMGFLLDNGKVKQEDVPAWLLRAREEQLTEGELHDSVIAGHVVKRPEPVRGKNRDGLLTIHGIGTTFQKWLKNLEQLGSPVDKMPTSEKQRIREEIKPIAELYHRLEGE